MDFHQQPPADTTIRDLRDDLLCEIFLRLPSLPSLLRAALACRAFLHAVRSLPDFRRRFCEVHPPQLIGFFVQNYDMPAFLPLRRCSDPDLAVAIRGADFFFTRLPADDTYFGLNWFIRDSHNGYVVLVSFSLEKMAVYNPFTRAMDIFPQPPVEFLKHMLDDVHVLSEEEPGSFRVICVCDERWSVRAAVFSSNTREWQIFPHVMDARMHYDDGSVTKTYLHRGTQVNGFIYWTKGSMVNARVLNIATMQFSFMDLPLRMKGQGPLSPGNTKDGKLCIVCADAQFKLVVWFRGVADDDVERWVLNRTFPLWPEIEVITRGSTDLVALKIIAIIDGFVYLSLYHERNPRKSGWILSFCLEETKLNKLCPASHFHRYYHYIMAWPRSLVFNKAAARHLIKRRRR